ncbi:unnamed protein product [Caenorhabditis bovis]|uniref:Uncharacterized protein n=1 Tax=Caenorhabditis bovis TaxID=2654633 RepID=A0A8S1F1I3_9PELO|nr:unnamed protein product [Caenorhabditis bovis]
MYVSKRSSLDTLIFRCFSIACFEFDSVLQMNASVFEGFAITPVKEDGKYVCFFSVVYVPPARGQHERMATLILKANDIYFEYLGTRSKNSECLFSNTSAYCYCYQNFCNSVQNWKTALSKAKSVGGQKIDSKFPDRVLKFLDIVVNRINVARMVYDERNFVHRRRRRRQIENQSDDGGEKKEISVKIPYLSIYTIAFLVLYISTGVLLYRFCKRLYKHKILRDPMSQNAIRRFPQ